MKVQDQLTQLHSVLAQYEKAGHDTSALASQGDLGARLSGWMLDHLHGTATADTLDPSELGRLTRAWIADWSLVAIKATRTSPDTTPDDATGT